MNRPKQWPGKTYEVIVGCGKLFITVNRDNGKICETFTSLGHCGSCMIAVNEAITRCISVGLQNGVPVEVYINALKGIRCDKPVLGKEHILSCPDALAKILELENNLDT